MAREQLQTLTEPMYYTLLALTHPMYGYEIMQTVQELSVNTVKIGAGTLYALLARFEKEGIIVQLSDDGRRKTYQITDKGRTLLNTEFQRLKNSVAAYNEFIKKPMKLAKKEKKISESEFLLSTGMLVED